MDKLAWVAAPLVLALAAVGWLAARGRPPSRAELNALFSVLLLIYVVATAALGIFWVAHQQLPVFDWHYLFGYATVLLLVIHLAFNLRAAWNVLRRRVLGGPVRHRPQQGGATTTPYVAGRATGRRPLLGLVGLGGLAMAGGAGYLVGLRHGRTELVVAASQLGTASSAHAADARRREAWAVVERFHRFTSHSRAGALRRAASPQWALAPPAFKRYPQARRLPLPAASARPNTLDIQAVGTWLWHTAGVSAHGGGIAFRTSPSSGALFATELYLRAFEVPGLPAGLWHYDAENHLLEALSDPAADDRRPSLGEALALPAGCVAVILASAVFARSGHKYGDRTYRYVTADLGHALENLRVAASFTQGMHARLMPLFDDAAATAHVGLDGSQEAVLAVVALCRGTATMADARAAQTWMVPPWPGGGAEGDRQHTPREEGTALDLTAAVHHASSLQRTASPGDGGAPGLAASVPAAGGGASGPGAAAAAVMSPGLDSRTPTTTAPGAGLLPGRGLPEPVALRPPDLGLIATRRSIRRYSGSPLPQAVVAALLKAMTATPPVLSDAVRIDVLTPSVQGLPAAAWRHDAATQALRMNVPHGDALRQRARAAALDQDVIGNAAVVFVFSLDREALRTDSAGPARAWRHGFIEVGMLGERLYLAGGALGLGVCAVGAFYDDEATALVGADAARDWVVHLCAVGTPVNTPPGPA